MSEEKKHVEPLDEDELRGEVKPHGTGTVSTDSDSGGGVVPNPAPAPEDGE